MPVSKQQVQLTLLEVKLLLLRYSMVTGQGDEQTTGTVNTVEIITTEITIRSMGHNRYVYLYA